MTIYLDGGPDIKEIERNTDRRELQKNASVLGQAHRTFYAEDRPTISILPKEIMILIAKFSLFYPASLNEKEKTEVAERAFRKPL